MVLKSIKIFFFLQQLAGVKKPFGPYYKSKLELKLNSSEISSVN